MHKSKPFTTFNPSKLITKHKTMTKTSIFGQSEVKQEEKKPIELTFCLQSHSDNLYKSNYKVEGMYKELVLLYNNGTYDVILAIEETDRKILFLGHWNDGVV